MEALLSDVGSDWLTENGENIEEIQWPWISTHARILIPKFLTAPTRIVWRYMFKINSKTYTRMWKNANYYTAIQSIEKLNVRRWWKGKDIFKMDS